MISILSIAKGLVLKFLVTAAALLCLLLPAGVNAQSILQNGGGALQQQDSQAQQTDNSQSQTGSPQAGGNQSVLNHPNAQPLGVISDPQQNSPDAVARPSDTLRSNSGSTAQTDHNLASIKFVVGFLGVFLVIVFIAYRFSKFDLEDQNPTDEQLDRSQLAESLKNQVSKPAKKKKSKKKRRKPHQR